MKHLMHFLLFLPVLAHAKSFTLIDDATKETYVCNSVATVTSTVTSTAASTTKSGDAGADCVTKITRLCSERGGTSAAACSELADRRCQDKTPKYADCARTTTQRCIDSSSGSASTCLDRSLRECK